MVPSTEPAPSERRHHQRVAFNSAANLQAPSGEPFAVRTRNISVGGLSVLSPQDLPAGTPCMIHVDIPDGRGALTGVVLQARVVNSMFNKIEGGFMVSFEFFNLSASVAVAIARFMKLKS